MDWETEAAAARSARMAELREVMQVVKSFGEETNGIMQDQQALAQWLALGGDDEGYRKINGRLFAAMTEQQQAMLVKEIGAKNG